MRAALFSMGSESSKRIIAAMQKEFDEVDHIDIRNVEMRIGKGKPVVLVEGKELKQTYDCVYLKSSFRYAQMQQALADFFDGKAYIPIKPWAYNVVNDKMLTHLALEKAGVPTPETYLTPTVGAAKALLKTINFPIILKIPGGTHGKGVMFAESQASAAGILDTLEGLKQAVIMQEYVDTDGQDIRAIVVGDKVVGSMVRKASGGEKRANIHAGGTAEAIVLDSHTKKVAINTAKALGADICAVDILESVKGPLVLEANLSPGLQGIMQATQRDIPKDFAIFLKQKTIEFRNAKVGQETAGDIVEEVQGNGAQQIISKLDFRGERILLSKIVSKFSKFTEDHEAVIKVKAGKIEIEKV